MKRKQTSFRLSADLLERLRQEARCHNRSLNNFVESILMSFLASRNHVPMNDTMKRNARTTGEPDMQESDAYRGFVGFP